MKNENGRKDRDPELEKLLAAWRETTPERSEIEGWKAAIRSEQAAYSARARRGSSADRAPVSVLRRVVRVAIQVGVAASIGFFVGAWFMERRLEDGGPSMSFSQTEPRASASYRPDLETNREVVRIRVR
jgi:hypothetical protein